MGLTSIHLKQECIRDIPLTALDQESHNVPDLLYYVFYLINVRLIYKCCSRQLQFTRKNYLPMLHTPGRSHGMRNHSCLLKSAQSHHCTVRRWRDRAGVHYKEAKEYHQGNILPERKYYDTKLPVFYLQLYPQLQEEWKETGNSVKLHLPILKFD